MLIALYLAAIVAANLSVAYFGPASTIVNAFLFIGLDLTARDGLHEAWNRRNLWAKMTGLIAVGSLVTWLLNRGAGRIALASFLAFAIAAVADTAIYHLCRRWPRLWKINGSNVVSAALDSLVFPTVAFGAVMPGIVLGQFLAKTVGGGLWAFILTRKWSSRATTGIWRV